MLHSVILLVKGVGLMLKQAVRHCESGGMLVGFSSEAAEAVLSMLRGGILLGGAGSGKVCLSSAN